MDPSVLQQFNAAQANFAQGWAAHAQALAINASHDNRLLTAAVASALLQADDPQTYAGMNVSARVPSTLEHPLYPGAAK